MVNWGLEYLLKATRKVVAINSRRQKRYQPWRDDTATVEGGGCGDWDGGICRQGRHRCRAADGTMNTSRNLARVTPIPTLLDYNKQDLPSVHSVIRIFLPVPTVSYTPTSL